MGGHLRYGQAGMIDFGCEARILEQQVHVAFEGPQDGPEAARLMAQIINFQDFRLCMDTQLFRC